MVSLSGPFSAAPAASAQTPPGAVVDESSDGPGDIEPVDDLQQQSRRRWHLQLLAISLVGLALRLGYVFLYRRHAAPTGDAFFYHYQANLIVDGKWFINPYQYFYFRHAVPAADHPPLWTLVLALAALIGVKSFFAQIVWSCVVGSVAVWLLGLAGRAVTGPRTGLITAAMAAAYPNFWINDGSLLSETLVLVFAALTVLTFYRLWRDPSLPKAAWLGVACALGSLARSELVLLVPVFVILAGLLVRNQAVGRRLVVVATVAIAAGVTLVPWWAYNQSRFSDSVPLSSQLGVTLATANCNTTYYGRLLGYWSLECALSVHTSKGADPSVQDHEYRDAAIHYAEHHESRIPVVVAARLGRELDLYRPRQQINLEWSILGRPRLPAYLGLGDYYLTALLAVGGIVTLRRRRIAITPFLSFVVVTLLVAAATFGQTRYRTVLDAAIVLLAAIALEQLLSRRRQKQPHGKHALRPSTARSSNPRNADWTASSLGPGGPLPLPLPVDTTPPGGP
jgi:4-amino-4-deoxy-L-arabinose transferase-like glycosyltransferase